ncbi:MAG: class I SAM-dependent methyltransferase [Bacteroidia bacterium]|nr:class I SAM-dependent methyltransferase [Bacteroidia bacterium]
MKNTYNFVAPYYSWLSYTVHGKDLINIQLDLIETLPDQGNILIMGGGSGDIIPHLYKHSPHLKIDYIDASSKMIALAQTKKTAGQQISFIHADTIPKPNYRYDAVFCAFFLDLYAEEEILNWLSAFDAVCTPKYSLHVADFQLNNSVKFRFWRMILIRLSILFFKLTTNHSTWKLEDIFTLIAKSNYKSIHVSYLKDNFLCLHVFKKL